MSIFMYPGSVVMHNKTPAFTNVTMLMVATTGILRYELQACSKQASEHFFVY